MCRLAVVAAGTMCQGRELSYHGEHGDNAQPVAAGTTKNLFGSLLTSIRRSQSSHRCVKVGGCWWLGRWWLVSAWHLMVEPGPEKASCVRAGTGLVVVTREGAGWSSAILTLILHLYSKYLEMGPGEPILPFACMLALLYISRALF